MSRVRQAPEPSERVSVVTGGAGGIGAAIVRALARRGHPVAIGFQNSKDSAARLMDELCGEGATVCIAQVDVASLPSVQSFATTVSSTLGPPLVLINNAGWKSDELLSGSDPDDWVNTVMVNLCGPYFLTRELLPPMLSARWGRIINISSVAGERGNPSQTAYCASKAGLNGLTKALAVEVGRRNVLVNAVAPGLVNTAMTRVLMPGLKHDLIKLTPQKRSATPEEIANVVDFLASDSASYVNGQILSVDGGLMA